ncbi:probable nad(p) transhydrogenase subunit alpha part 2 transmembrane protein [Fulvimarina pelagi HTCC2506]|uniref:proton-translocating NAD(P)(+) transhydrogenase n=2 Tax=Fulvimarina pelagi TaxID=217511 RepID=Q0G0B2_9HYPH|nr:NAD(P) transhydrogenase subunit alpha [Fulvimarina pelagi]EAU40681.1 probable nad(p) transhydrogenase subunit alpha part 2 transmembrane protein [Fulvimarina pelagi HTCC2506]BAT31224.1 NAD(P) transhydrogenase subunit alpha part 2 transmembrane protein [Fulvimarina pelagi]
MENETAQNTLQKLNQAGAAIREARQGVEQMIGEGAVSEAAGHAAASGVPFVFYLAIFVLACFVGYYVVWSVTAALHTPLMSVTNAISSVIVVGAILAIALSTSWAATIFGFIALVLASVNIFGGFLVTQRMLGMYKKKS